MAQEWQASAIPPQFIGLAEALYIYTCIYHNRASCMIGVQVSKTKHLSEHNKTYKIIRASPKALDVQLHSLIRDFI